MLNSPPKRPPKGYSLYSEFNTPTPGKGLVVLVRKDVPHMRVQLQTGLQAIAFRVGLKQQYTICNMYISPNETLLHNDITALTNQLQAPIIICGDLNSRHPLWDHSCRRQDARSRAIERTLLESSLTVLNNGDATHFHTQTATLSAIDLTMCSCLLYTSPSPRDKRQSRMPSSA